jgi:hypothetical protein
VQFFYVGCDFSNHDCPVLQNGVKRTRKTVTLETKILVIIKWKLEKNVKQIVFHNAAEPWIASNLVCECFTRRAKILKEF